MGEPSTSASALPVALEDAVNTSAKEIAAHNEKDTESEALREFHASCRAAIAGARTHSARERAAPSTILFFVRSHEFIFLLTRAQVYWTRRYTAR